MSAYCPECEADIETTFHPGRPAQTYGRNEDCYSEDPPELEHPDDCAECGYVFTAADVERWMIRAAEEIEEMEGMEKDRDY